MNSWKDNFTQEPSPTPFALWEAAREYSILTEKFDKTVCTGPVTSDGILPATRQEAAKINAHALAVLRQIRCRIEEQGFSREDLSRAMSAYERSPQAADDLRDIYGEGLAGKI